MEVIRFVVICSQIVVSIGLENLAFNKSATQSSNLHEHKWLAGAAVDGNRNQTLANNSCACTDHYKSVVWWRVNLGNVYGISNVTIYNRNEEYSFTYRLSGFKLYVTLQEDVTSSSPAYVNNNGMQSRPFPTANFTVQVETYGQYVTLFKDRFGYCTGYIPNINWCALFELCEVEVLGCHKSKYGTDCQNDCPDNCLYDVCDVSNGTCYECEAGYTGDMCDQSCTAGNYGYNCNETCGTCLDDMTCNIQTGYCDNGCAAGWKGDKCDIVCNFGTYGFYCLHNCSGNCANETACNRTDGSCQYGCKNGWKGDICTQVCESGKYGSECTETCGRCINSATCNRETGACQQGCTDGYKGVLCRERCNIGFYGKNCSLKCSKCNVTCDYVTGECPGERTPNAFQDLKLPFIIYGVISSVIIFILSCALILCFLRKGVSPHSDNRLRTDEFECSVSNKSGLRNESFDHNKTSSKNIRTRELSYGQQSKTEKYEELGNLRGDRNKYKTLKKDEESQDKNKKDEESQNKIYDELQAAPTENTYEPLRSEGNSKYANA